MLWFGWTNDSELQGKRWPCNRSHSDYSNLHSKTYLPWTFKRWNTVNLSFSVTRYCTQCMPKPIGYAIPKPLYQITKVSKFFELRVRVSLVCRMLPFKEKCCAFLRKAVFSDNFGVIKTRETLTCVAGFVKQVVPLSLPVSYTHWRCRRIERCRSRWLPYH